MNYQVTEYSSDHTGTRWESTVPDVTTVLTAINGKGHTIQKVRSTRQLVTIEYVAAGSNRHYVTELVPA